MTPIVQVPLAPVEPTARRSRRQRLKEMLGLDKAIVFTILARGWSAVAGLVTVTLIARYLSPAEQGYYFTFGSLVAMQLIFELGFSVVILQLATHECAHLQLHADGAIAGPESSRLRLASILQKSVRWYTVAALLMVAFLMPAGSRFFLHAATGNAQPVHFMAPWLLLVAAAGLTFQIDPVFSFLEGCGYIANVAQVRLWQAGLGSVLAWVALLTHHGLFAPAMIICGQACAGLIFLFRRRHLLLNLLRAKPDAHRIDWWKEVWPFQWRIAVSYSCGYLIFQLFNPILFRYRGPVEAGRMGMSLAMGNMLTAVAIAWVTTKAAPFGAMIARSQWKQLDHAFFNAVGRAVALATAGAVVLWLACVYLNHRGLGLAHRILAPLPFALLLLGVLVNVVVSSEALYLRAHKQEKFLINSVAGAIATAASAWFLGRRFGALGMTGGNLILGLIIGLGFGTWTFAKYRKEWHA